MRPTSLLAQACLAVLCEEESRVSCEVRSCNGYYFGEGFSSRRSHAVHDIELGREEVRKGGVLCITKEVKD